MPAEAGRNFAGYLQVEISSGYQGAASAAVETAKGTAE